MQAGIITLQCAMDCLRGNQLTVCLHSGSLITLITLQLGLSLGLQLAHRQDEELALLAGVVVAAAAGVPARVVQLVPHVRHGQPVDHLHAGSGAQRHDRGQLTVVRCVRQVLSTHSTSSKCTPHATQQLWFCWRCLGLCCCSCCRTWE
jgi:hypothetical protein